MNKRLGCGFISSDTGTTLVVRQSVVWIVEKRFKDDVWYKGLTVTESI